MTVRQGGGATISLEEAFALLDAQVGPLDVVEVPLREAVGLVLARDIVCREGFPPFSRSAMDGFAVRAGDVPSAGARLRLDGTVRAGSAAGGKLAPGTCMRIMTGAPVPEGADAVVMQEDTSLEGAWVVFRAAARTGGNIRLAGEDMKPGQVACPAGTRLGPAQIGACALAGAARPSVFRRPAVCVITTGDELAAPEDPSPPPGFIRNSNGPMLIALLAQIGIGGRDLGVVRDDPARLREAFEEGLGSDLLLVTGGVSVGQFDYVTEVMSSFGLEFLLRKVKVKPGKPIHFAAGPRGRVFGLPGNPVSVLTSFHLFVKPALKAMMGRRDIRPILEGRLQSALRPHAERTLVQPCRCELVAGSYELAPVRFNGSGDLPGASGADGLAIVPAGADPMEAGVKLKFIRMEEP